MTKPGVRATPGFFNLLRPLPLSALRLLACHSDTELSLSAIICYRQIRIGYCQWL